MNCRFLSLPILFLLPLGLMARGGSFEEDFRANASAWLNALPEAQQKACLLPRHAEERWAMQYTGGPRPGLLISTLAAESRRRVEALLRSLVSEYGWQQVQHIAEQEGPDTFGYYTVTCFGDPRTDDTFAWRISDHHLTLVLLVVREGKVTEFGPMLLGADPPTLWTREEQDVINLWKSLGERASTTLQTGRGIASLPPKGQPGLAVRDLPPEARQALEKLWQQRLDVFAPPLKSTLLRLVDQRGGLQAQRLAFYNQPAEKLCRDGGQWDWKLYGEGFLLDLETSRRHVHLSTWIKAEPSP